MENFLHQYGLMALFVLSFLASTLVPLGSEWILITLLLNGHSPVQSVAVATAGNTLGACTTYLIGLWGAPLLVEKVLRISKKEQQKAEQFYGRYGSLSLLFSWVPVLGDPICLAGGMLNVRFTKFLILVFSGKLIRYCLISLATIKVST